MPVDATATNDPSAADPRFVGLRRHWLLDPAVTFLNHGSFGACPVAVLDEQRRIRDELERQPVDFLDRRLPGLLSDARTDVAAFVGADPAATAFVPNATTGVNTVVGALELRPGDEVVTTDHVYPAVHETLRRRCEAAGARLVLAPLPLPLPAPAAVADLVLGCMTPRTRLLVVDQVTSATAALLPAASIAAAARAAGVTVVVDGAHAPGMLPSPADVDCDVWVGNLHKWVCAPKGAAVLVAKGEWRERLRPLVTSHAHLEGFLGRFDWTGTHDPSPYLAAPAAIRFFAELGWDDVMAHNRALAAAGRRVVADALGTPQLVPDDAAGSMTIVGLPPGVAVDRTDARERQAAFYERTRIEVPFVPWPGGGFLRLSAHVYNEPADYDRLATAAADLLVRS